MTFRIDDLNGIPTQPGVYFFYDAKDVILYIGKAKHLRNRLSQYFQA
jgi:excinuclease ABC subunit C